MFKSGGRASNIGIPSRRLGTSYAVTHPRKIQATNYLILFQNLLQHRRKFLIQPSITYKFSISIGFNC